MTLCRVVIPDAPERISGGVPIAASPSARPAPPGGAIADPAHQVRTLYVFEEQFADFRDVDGLTLPTVRRVRLTRQGQADNVGLFTAASEERSMLEWQMEISNWEVNPTLSADHFKIY